MRSSPTLLLVADDAQLLRGTAEALCRHGYSIRVASSVGEAFALIDRHPHPDLLVIDAAMASPPGLRVLDRVRRTPRWSGIPVVLIGPDGDGTLAGGPAREGAFSRLSKPFQLQELFDTIEAHLGAATAHVGRGAPISPPAAGHLEVDLLTGCLTRDAVQRLLKGELERAVGQRSPLSVIRLDLDRLDGINLALGRDAGDAVLRRVGAWLGNARPGPVHAGRYDGDEFLVVLPGSDAEGAAGYVHRAHRRLSAQPIACGRDTLFATFSAGISARAAGSPDADAQVLIERAGAALRAAKRAGRHALCIAEAQAAAIA